jgi:hypothetical protein
MKYRWLLGLTVSLMGCSSDPADPPATSGSGGSGGQGPATGGSSSTPKGGSSGSVATGGTSQGGSGGAKTTTGGTSPGGATSGGAASGGVTSGGGAGGASGGTTNGGAGAATTGGTSGGAAPTGGTGGGTAPGGTENVLERNGNPARTGHFVQPKLTKAAAAKMTFEASFKAEFKGNMYASPLYVKDGPGGKGVFFAVSADNQVAALDETTGATVWSKSLGASPGKGGQACGFGNDPVGILSTPVIDAATRTIYVAVATGTSAVERHEIHALSIEDGAPKAGWPVNVNNLKSGSTSFNAPFQNQRSALSLVNGTVYVGYGGYVGDCGDYRGWIVAVDAADPTKTGAWASLGKGDAIWAAGGFASDGTAIFPVTGNNMAQASSRSATDSEAVLRFTGLAALERNDQNQFFPTSWKSMDTADADLGGTNTMLITVPGATPETMLVAIAKDGHFYLVNPANLGGEGGHVVDFRVATGAMAIKTVPTTYRTSKGTYVAFTTDSGAECPNNVSGRALMSVLISPGAPPTADTVWCAPGGNPSTAPISTSVDGTGDAIVWHINGGALRGFDGDTGEAVFSGEGSCSNVQRWTSPIAVNGRIVTGSNGKLCSWAAP